MEDFSLFVKTNLAEIIISVVAVIASIVIIYFLKKHPDKMGFTEKPSKKMYLLALAPFVVMIWVFSQMSGGTPLSYPTGIAIHQNAIAVEGIVEVIRENTIDETTYTETVSKTLLYDKTTGKEIASLSGFSPMYFAGGRMLGSANFGYHIVDLATGDVLKVVSEDDIKARAAAFAGEKIYSIELKKGETSFAIRSVRDKKFVYDPILEKEISPETHTPFYTGYRNEKFASKKIDLFLAEELGKTKDGITLVLSYDDLEKKTFIISAISPGGDLLWTKRDFEISPDLAGEEFTIEGTGRNTALDDQNFYFVNNKNLVCASLANGQLKWIMPI